MNFKYIMNKLFSFFFLGFDSLPCYEVTVANGEVKVRGKNSLLEANKRVKPMAKKNENVTKHIVVIGGGPAAAECVEVLRQEGYDGILTMVCKEKFLPYDRVSYSIIIRNTKVMVVICKIPLLVFVSN